MKTIDRRTLLGLAGAGLAMPAMIGPTRAQSTRLAMGVGGKPLLYYLPLTIAERQGLFKAEGLDGEINDFSGGAKSLQALIGGSVDLVAGAYEHTLRMQAKGQDIRAVIELLRFPTIVIGLRKDLAGKIKSPKDFKGLKIGVTAPGSSTYITAAYAMTKAGLAPQDASFVGVGGGASAVAAMKKGEIDVISHLDPVIAKLESDGDIVVLIDTRTQAGTQSLFGGSNPAACLYARADFIAKNPGVIQSAVKAMYKALRWLDSAPAEAVAAAVPEEYHLGDKGLYIKAFNANREAYSKTGVMSEAGMQSVADTITLLDPELKTAHLEIGKTFEPRFVQAAAGK